MQLLLIEPDRAYAERLHSEMLRYRGVGWNLVHCQDMTEAHRWLEKDRFQFILYGAKSELTDIGSEIASLVRFGGKAPIVTLLDSSTVQHHLRMLHLGAYDSLSKASLAGTHLMSSLRMATARGKLESKHLEMILQRWTATPVNSAGDAIEDSLSTQSSPTLSATTFGASESGSGSGTSGNEDQRCRVTLVHPPEFFSEITQEIAASPTLFDVRRIDRREDFVSEMARLPVQPETILIHQAALERWSDSILECLSNNLGIRPFIVLMHDESDFAATSLVEQGFIDCLPPYHMASEISLSIQKAALRLATLQCSAHASLKDDHPVSDRRKNPREPGNRRQHPRYVATRALHAIPVLPNGSPETDYQIDAISVDFSLRGMGLEFERQTRLPSKNWVIGVEDEEGQFTYVNAQLRHTQYADQTVRVGVMFANPMDDLFATDHLQPDIDPVTKQMTYQLDPDTLEQWCELGVLSRSLVNRIKVCPDCQGVCAVGDGCQQCGSSDCRHDELIHHFACAHVDRVATFQQESEIACPKCLSSGLIVGADFEIIKSRYECGVCHFRGSQLERVSSCLHCRTRFPINHTLDQDIIHYHVNRLDLLAVLRSP